MSSLRETPLKLLKHCPFLGVSGRISIQNLSSDIKFQKMFLVRRPSTVSYRAIHSSGVLSNPRFKLEIERPDKQNSPQDNKDEGGAAKGFLKSHPYRQLNPWKSRSELAAYLVQNCIFDDYGLFVTNKPFGVGVRKPITAKHKNPESQLHLRGLNISAYCLEDLLPELRHLLKKPELVLVKSTEKLTSGPAVFAEDEKSAQRCSRAIKASKGFYLQDMFTFHILTTLTPLVSNVDEKEVVGVAVKSFAETDKGQPVIVREFSRRSVKRDLVQPIQVMTKPLRSGYHGGCLVEIRTNGTHNNFLRVHCADKLAPVLGDNLYSGRVRLINGYPTKIDPTHLTPGSEHQLLSRNMLEILNLRDPENSVMVPAHIHMRKYKLYNYPGKKSEIELEAPYPSYFRWTCARLGITLDADSENAAVKL